MKKANKVDWPEPLPGGLRYSCVFTETRVRERDFYTHIDLNCYQLGGDTSPSCVCGYFTQGGKEIKIPDGVTLHCIEDDGTISKNLLKKRNEYWFIIHLSQSHVLRYNKQDYVRLPSIIERVGGFID